MAIGARGISSTTSSSCVAASLTRGRNHTFHGHGDNDDDTNNKNNNDNGDDIGVHHGKDSRSGGRRERRSGANINNISSRIGGPSSFGCTIEPIIRKGTHARVKAIERAIDAFLSLTMSQPTNYDDGGDVQRKQQQQPQQQQRQIVILGSGRDTNYLRYMYGNKKYSVGDVQDEDNATQQHQNNHNVRWYEVDHPSVVKRKAREWLPNCVLPHGYTYRCNVVHGNAAATDIDSNVIDDDVSYATTILSPENGDEDTSPSTIDPTQENIPNYHLIGHDLRSPSTQLFEKLSRPSHGYDKSCPTLFVLECVLMYLPECSIRDLLRCISESSCTVGSGDGGDDSSSSSFVAIAVYDPIPSHDGFGRTMIDNLHRTGIASTRGVGSSCGVNECRGMRIKSSFQVIDEDNENKNRQLLLGLEGTRTLSDQLSRLVHSGGFDIAIGSDMMSAYNHGVISEEERRIAAKCEMLDELEEFVLLMEHYCFVVGVVFPRSMSGKKTNLLDENDNNRIRVCDAERLCSIGVDSPIGFQEGHCAVLRHTPPASDSTTCLN